MSWSLRVSVEIDGKVYNISKKCDYRLVLDILEILSDTDFSEKSRNLYALQNFYENFDFDEQRIERALKEMHKIIDLGNEIEEKEQNKPRIMDWKHDFPIIAPAVSRVLGYSVRSADKYTHWWDFMGAYQEIGGDCLFANVISIRNKKQKGKKLEKYEQEFYQENRKMVDLPLNITEEEQEWLDSDW